MIPISTTSSQKSKLRIIGSATTTPLANSAMTFPQPSIAISSGTPQVSERSTANSSQAMKYCAHCDTQLLSSVRTMIHVHCGLRFCAEHLEELSATLHSCPRCAKVLKKEDLVYSPSLSQSSRGPNEQRRYQQQQYEKNNNQSSAQLGVGSGGGQQQRMKLMTHLENQAAPQQSKNSVVGTQQSPAAGTSRVSNHLYECPICNLKGLQHHQLLDHSRQHANEPGKCPICELRYKRDYFSKHLYGHLMLRHKDAKTANNSTQASQAPQTVNTTANNNNATAAAKRSNKNASNPSQILTATSARNLASSQNRSQQHLLQASKGIQQINTHNSRQSTLQQTTQGPKVPHPISTKNNQTLSSKDRKSTTNLTANNSSYQSNGQIHSIQASTLTRQKSQNQPLSTIQNKGAPRLSQQSKSNMTASILNKSSNNNTELSSSINGKTLNHGIAAPSHAKRIKQQQELNDLTNLEQKQDSFLVPQIPIANISLSQQKESVVLKQQAQQQLQNNHCLSQGLLGVYTFSIQNEKVVQRHNDQIQDSLNTNKNGDDVVVVKRKLQLTSQYLSSTHKSSLLKHQKPTPDVLPFKLFELQKFLHKQVPQRMNTTAGKDKRSQKESSSEHTDDGLSSDSDNISDGADLVHQIEGFKTHVQDRESLVNIKLVQQKASVLEDEQIKNSNVRKQKSGGKLDLPVYLQEIDRICFPEGLPADQNVILKRKDDRKDKNKKVIYQNNSPTNNIKRVDLAGGIAQSPHRQNYFSSGKKFSFSPMNSNLRMGLKKDAESQEQLKLNNNDQHHHQQMNHSVPRFNNSVNTPQMMLFQKQMSPKSNFDHQKQFQQHVDAAKGECTLEAIEKLHKNVYYSTRTADDEIQYLSILVCAQPSIIQEEFKQTDDKTRKNSEDDDQLFEQNTVDETNEEHQDGIKAILQPFVLVIVTTQAAFESAMGAQILNLIYDRCLLPMYKKLCFASPLSIKHSQLSQFSLNDKIGDHLGEKQIQLEVMISVLFDVINIFSLSKEDVFRQINWRSLTENSIAYQELTQVNSMFLVNQKSFIDGNFNFRRLFQLVSTDNLIKLLSCMFLEKKIVLIGDSQNYQEQMAPLIEALLRLFYPLDCQVFTNVSYTLSEEMVYYMEKPGSIIMGMPKNMWIKQGQRVFNDSFDTYIVAYDIEAQKFHLKTEDQPIGLPRTFNKLLRRTISSIDQDMSDIYISFQLKQAVFNTILLMISFLKGKEALRITKNKLQATKTNTLQIDSESKVKEDESDSQNSQQTLQEDGQLNQQKKQYPDCSEYLEEFKTTTAFIDLSEKLERKDPSIVYITECLQIIEQQKKNWFIKLLEFQVKKTAPDLLLISDLLYPNSKIASVQNDNNNSYSKLLKILTVDEILQAYKIDQKLLRSKASRKNEKSLTTTIGSEINFSSLPQMFKINKRLVSKTLRTRLFEIKSNSFTDYNPAQCGRISDGLNIPNSSYRSKVVSMNINKENNKIGTGVTGIPQLVLNPRDNSSRNNNKLFGSVLNSSRTPDYDAANRQFNTEDKNEQIQHHQPQLTLTEQRQSITINQGVPPQPQQSDVTDRENSYMVDSPFIKTPEQQHKAIPKTPDSVALQQKQRQIFSLTNEAEVPSSLIRGARYSSTHKPQIAFKQVRSSQSPPAPQLPELTPQADVLHNQNQQLEESKEKPNGGFFSMLSNFFSTGKDMNIENKMEEQLASSRQNMDEQFKDIVSRKASKSMQVSQPQFVSFQKPLDMQDLCKIKTLSSGITILKALKEQQHIGTELIKMSQYQSQPPPKSNFSVNNLRKPSPSLINKEVIDSISKEAIQYQPYTTRNAFMKNQSASKQLQSENSNYKQRLETANFAALSPPRRKSNLNDMNVSYKVNPIPLAQSINNAMMAEVPVDKHFPAQMSIDVVNQEYLTDYQVDEIEDDSGTAMQTFANEEGFTPILPLQSSQKQSKDQHNINAIKDSHGNTISHHQLQQDVRISAPSFAYNGNTQKHLSKAANPNLRSSVEESLSKGVDAYYQRPSLPMSKASSPGSKGFPFFSAPQEIQGKALKRTSLNAANYFEQQQPFQPLRLSANLNNSTNQIVEESALGENHNLSKAQATENHSQRNTAQESSFTNAHISIVSTEIKTTKISLNNTTNHAQNNNYSQSIMTENEKSQVIESFETPNSQAAVVEIPMQVSASKSLLIQPASLQATQNVGFAREQSRDLSIQGASSTTNSQKLKISINKLQSKQVSVGSQLKQATAHMAISSSQPTTQKAISSNNQGSFKTYGNNYQTPQSAQSSSATQNTGNNKFSKNDSSTMRKLKHCISPKIALKGQTNANRVSGPTSSIQQQQQRIGNRSLLELGKQQSSGHMKVTKQLSQSSQNIKYSLNQSRRVTQQQQQNGVVQQSSDSQPSDTSRKQGVDSQLEKKFSTQITSSTEILKKQQSNNAIDQQKPRGKSNTRRGLGMSSSTSTHNVNLFSPRKNGQSSPKDQTIKQRPKAFSQISTGKDTSTTSVQQTQKNIQSYQPSKNNQQQSSTTKYATNSSISASKTGTKSLIVSQQKSNHTQNNSNQQTTNRQLVTLFSQQMGVIHSQSVQQPNDSSATVIDAQDDKKGRSRSKLATAVSQNLNKNNEPLNHLITSGLHQNSSLTASVPGHDRSTKRENNQNSRSTTRLFSGLTPLQGGSQENKQQFDRSSGGGGASSSIFALGHQHGKGNRDAKRNSMTQMPKVQDAVILASRQQQHQIISDLAQQSQTQQQIIGNTKGMSTTRAASSFQQIDFKSTAKEMQTPSDLESTLPKNPRKQQKLTKVAQEKKGDEEQVEMENLQEIVESGCEAGNRIRSISHQFPSQISFLRASQDKMHQEQQ